MSLGSFFKPKWSALNRAAEVGGAATFYPLNKTAAGKYINPNRVRYGLGNYFGTRHTGGTTQTQRVTPLRLPAAGTSRPASLRSR